MTLDRSRIESIVLRILEEERSGAPLTVIAGVSNRHCHLSRRDADVLFGQGYALRKDKDLRQPGQFASKETVHIVTHGGVLENVRVLGPLREKTQVEVSMTDARRLGVSLPLVRSGSTVETPGILLVGPEGSISCTSGVGIAWRHMHLSPEEADCMGLQDNDEVDVEVGGDRGLVFRRVWVRVRSDMLSEFHVDVDEANSCGLKTGDRVTVLRPAQAQ
ncbi:MAG TPA: phosphate propanoyltransferase [Synergistaceae bacterium]|nr:phosphate propanoyltransferase [Synergistaceae bacterium]